MPKSQPKQEPDERRLVNLSRQVCTNGRKMIQSVKHPSAHAKRIEIVEPLIDRQAAFKRDRRPNEHRSLLRQSFTNVAGREEMACPGAQSVWVTRAHKNTPARTHCSGLLQSDIGATAILATARAAWQKRYQVWVDPARWLTAVQFHADQWLVRSPWLVASSGSLQ